LYANATLFVMPSFEEGFGLPVLEAMASGIPVIASDGGALPEIVGNAGLIFHCSDSQSLSQAILECLDNNKLYTSLVAKGLERMKKYSWQATAEIIWNTLNDL